MYSLIALALFVSCVSAGGYTGQRTITNEAGESAPFYTGAVSRQRFSYSAPSAPAYAPSASYEANEGYQLAPATVARRVNAAPAWKPAKQYTRPAISYAPISAPVSAPIATTYAAPIATAYAAPIATTYAAPITASYSAPVYTPSYNVEYAQAFPAVSSISSAPVETFGADDLQQPIRR